ncbi:hypothetical protein ACHAWU_002489 [Discostella pseudostelligera]|uniref:Uncharacterized protein n=1 Tax=Discostella pseudostelligera TaxID=259834 RepID=A0ABD3M2H7_9STRA
MKIFGKRKSSGSGSAVASPGTDATAAASTSTSGENTAITLSAKSQNEDVPSYFAQASTGGGGGSSSKKKKQRTDDTTSSQQPNGDDIQALLAMGPSKLNSKQRRLVRRHQQREGIEETNAVEIAENATDEVKCIAPASSNNKEQSASQEKVGNDSVNAVGASSETVVHSHQEASSSASTTTSEILAKLEGLNSKDRRKFLRQLRSSMGGNIDESVIAAAEEQARKVAERNEQEAVLTNTPSDKASKPSKAKVGDEKSTRNSGQAANVDETKPKSKRRKKNPINLDDLDPEERKRREAQRIMQKEAAERRASGLVDPNRHPLNSERRRANRRKPGKAAKIVQAKKEKLAERGKFNAVGYQMRKKGGT